MADSTSVDRVVIRFAGDSGDGMQLTGDRFTSDAAFAGNDISTLPNYPAEIRAPQGTVHGVSSFQVNFAASDIATPGDAPDVLVAMNPAALKANLKDVPRGGVIIVDTADFTSRNLAKVGFASNPLETDELDQYHVHALDLTQMTINAVSEFGLGRKEAARAKNMFALGLLTWLYDRPTESTIAFINAKFAKKKPEIAASNVAAFTAGYHYGETSEDFAVQYHVAPAPMPAGRYRQVSGNQATAMGLIAGAQQSGLQLFLGSYPITPASDILHELAKHKEFGILTFQAEDEIAGVCSAIGASFAGNLAVTTTSGPGLALKGEAIGLAVMMELPLVIVDVQRAGPSTGMPTKTEQSDLFQAMYGRNGEAPLPVIAPKSPSDCFYGALEACKIAVERRTPVILLTDGYLGNGAEPWKIPNVEDLPTITPNFATETNGKDAAGNPLFLPYKRDEETFARAMAIPGTPGLEHRIGGLEKADGIGTISYDAANHEHMTAMRAAKVQALTTVIGDAVCDDPNGDAKTLVLGWGSTYGPSVEAVRSVRKAGHTIAHMHLRYINPFPANLGEILARYDRVIIPEMNSGQLCQLIRATYLVDAQSYSRVRGLPISSNELAADLIAMLEGAK